MPPSRHHSPRRKAVLCGLLVAVLGACATGCGCRPAAPAPPAAAPAPAVPAPPRPADSEPPEPSRPEPPTSAAGVTFGAETLAGVRFGMGPADLALLLGVPGEVVERDDTGLEVLRFSDTSGAAVVARFEGGRLTRKTLTRPEDPAEPAPPAEPEAPLLTEERYHLAQAGMDLEALEVLFGVAPALVSAGADGMAIYRWSDAQGASFTARFDAGKLSRKTGLYVARSGEDPPAAETEATETEADPGEVEGAEGEQPEGEYLPGEGEAGGIVIEAQERGEAAPPEPEERAAPTAPRPARERVHVARRPPVIDPATGEARRPVSANEARRKAARLPKFRRSLRQGDYELRIMNTGAGRIEAGLRSGDLGRDFQLGPGQARSLRVGRGTYTLYFIHDDDPETLHQGRGVTIDGAYTTDMEIRVMDESYAVDYLRTDPGY